MSKPIWAYPQKYLDEPTPSAQQGMTLRDYFAAKAMGGWLASFGPTGAPTNLGELASFAYRIADAMVKAREA